jgi:hypothetical protein
MADIRITPGSSIMAFTSSLSYKQTITQDPSGSVVLYGSGSTNRTNIFAIDGASGRLFSVTDDFSNSLFSANTISGLPVIEAFADSTVKIGKYGQEAIVVSGSGGNLQLSGSIVLPSLVTAADTNVVVFNTTSKKISYNTALSLQGTQGTTGNTVQGAAGNTIQGSSGATVQGAAGNTIQGSSGATIQGSSGATIQGSSGATIQGSAGATIQGSAGAQGTPGTTIQGAAGTAIQGSPGTAIQGSPGTSVQGSPGTSVQGSAGAQGSPGTAIQGSPGTSVQGSPGTSVQGTIGTSVQGSAGANAGITSFTNGVDNRVLTAASSTTINAEANLTYDGTTLYNTIADGYVQAYKDADEYAALRSLGLIYINRGGQQIVMDAQFGGVGSGQAARITSTGNLNIYSNNTAGTGTIGVYGTLATTGAITATGNITAYFSDERLKKDLEPIENALSKIDSLRAVTYYQNEIADSYLKPNTEKQVGVIAQDIQKILPEAVKPAPFDVITDKDGNKTSLSGENYLTVQYEKIVPLLIAAIQELTDKVNDLEEQLKTK